MLGLTLLYSLGGLVSFTVTWWGTWLAQTVEHVTLNNLRVMSSDPKFRIESILKNDKVALHYIFARLIVTWLNTVSRVFKG